MKRPVDASKIILLLGATLLPAGCTAQTDADAVHPGGPAPAAKFKRAPSELFTRHEDLRPVFFAVGESQLNTQSMQMLKENVDWLKRHLPTHILVAGFSDGQGAPGHNLAVGQRRAAALRDFYVAMGIPRSRISTISYGQEEPVCFDPTEECRAQNRRADTLVENRELAKQ